ncbi:hypothetical protein [Burkholderia multivorans]|uniref:hypothetical protein n=1 Tax=Burkholderia multivorans TaxID=87883 RepID=UPI0019063951|nr:hypothetical protein [Burkholderia multivorans]MBJ9625009.1 hypothetical protein [Burkholderia multivorans]
MNRWTKEILKCVLGGVLSSVAASACADDYPCRVVMCILNPNGPWDEKTVCAPTMDRYVDDVVHGRFVPECKDSETTIRRTWNPFDPCPDGTREAGRGEWVVEGVRKSGARKGGFQWALSEYDFTLKGRPERSYGGNYGVPGERLACVGKAVGQFVTYLQGSGGRAGQAYSTDMETLNVYDRVIWQEPKNPFAFDVFNNGKMETRVHVP